MADTTQYLYKLRATRTEMLSVGPTPAETAILADHFRYLEDLAARGVVLLVGRTLNPDDAAFGIVILTAATTDDAREVMAGDPAVAANIMAAELFPFRIALVGKL